MTQIKSNIAIGFLGNIWQVLIGIAFIPLYIKILGIESYGLIGFFTMLQSMFSLLEMGLSVAVTRELARLSVIKGKDQHLRNLVRTLEVVYWILAGVSCIVVFISAPFIANNWLNVSTLPEQSIEQVIRLMAFAMALQFPAAFYSGGLTGLQQQFSLNIIGIISSTLRGLGALLTLYFVSPNVQAFFGWQIAASFFNTAILALFLWGSLPKTIRKSVFDWKLLKTIWRFAAGLSGIAILSTIFTQLDKLILSKLLSLENFAYYTLASVVAMNIVRLVTPVFNATYPKFTQLVELGDQGALKILYHKASQLVSVLILPVGIVIAMFSYEFLLLWTQSQETAEATYLILRVLMIGSTIFCLLHVPYALQLANGWTKLPLFNNTIVIIFYIPMLLFMTYSFGPIGGAISWFLLNIGQFIVPIFVMHRRLLKEEKWNWYIYDIFFPFIVCFTIVVLGRILMGDTKSQASQILLIGFVFFFTLIGTILSTSTTRSWAINNVKKYI